MIKKIYSLDKGNQQKQGHKRNSVDNPSHIHTIMNNVAVILYWVKGKSICVFSIFLMERKRSTNI